MQISQKQKDQQREQVQQWFRKLRDRLCRSFEDIEQSLQSSKIAAYNADEPPGCFQRKLWQREDDSSEKGAGGGGEISLMRGRVFEKIGVNISTVHGAFVPELQSEVKGAAKDGRFWASGISLVAHPRSPLVPAAHFNTRYIESEYAWFGGGGDITPTATDEEASKIFHKAFQSVCDKYEPQRYRKYAKACDDYFYIRHRKRPRGAGGIFFDYLNDDWQRDFQFTREVGEAFLRVFPRIVRERCYQEWSEEQRQQQLRVRGYYTEFNLLYDRGTRFGLLTGGNNDAVLMSLPPLAAW